MKKILRIILIFAVLLGIAAAGVKIWLAGPADPSFEGKKFSAWLQDTANKSPEVREAAKAALKKMDAQALPPLLERLRYTDSEEKQKWAATFSLDYKAAMAEHLAAVRGIKALGGQAKSLIPDLIKMLDNEATNPDAASALAAIGPDAIEPMIGLLGSSNPLVRKAAANVLGRNGPAAASAVPALLKALKDEDTDARYFAADALGGIKSDAPHVVPALITMLDDKQNTVVAAAASSLGQFGELAKDALPKLKPLAKSHDQSVNGAAKTAISNISPDKEMKFGPGNK